MSALESNPQVPTPIPHMVLSPGIDGRAGGALMGVVAAVLKFVGVDLYMTDWAASNSAEWLALAMYIALAIYFTVHTLKAKKE